MRGSGVDADRRVVGDRRRSSFGESPAGSATRTAARRSAGTGSRVLRLFGVGAGEQVGGVGAARRTRRASPRQVLGVVMKVPSPERPSKTRRFLRIRPFEQRFEFERFRHGDREALVVVAGPVDVGLEEDFVAEQFEPEASGLAVRRIDVVDGGLRSGGGGSAGSAAARGGDEAVRRLWSSPGSRWRPGFEGRPGAARRRPRVDAQPDRQVDADVLQFADRFFEPSRGRFGVCLTMNWVKPQFGWAAACSKNWSGSRPSSCRLRAVPRCRCPPASRSRPWGWAGRWGR